MQKNVGHGERWLRGAGALGLMTCAVMAPLPLGLRASTFGLMGAVMLWTAITGKCLGYKLLGRSTCSTERS